MSNALSNDQMMQMMGDFGEVSIRRIGHVYEMIDPWQCDFSVKAEDSSLTTSYTGQSYDLVVKGLFENVKHLIIGD